MEWQHLISALAVVGAFSLLWRLYAWIAPEPADMRPERLAHGHDDDADFSSTLASYLNAPILDGNRIELLENGVEIFPAMLDAVRDAQHTVNLLTYIYWTGAIADEFADALADAARRGVAVRVLLDAFGASRMDERLTDRMREAGCEIARFHGVNWYNLRRLNNRTHRKVLVVDGRIGFTGGVGIATEWTGNAEDTDHWRDDHFRVTGPAVSYLQGGFAENWLDATGEVVAAGHLFPALQPCGEARVLPILASPRGDRSPIAFSYWLAFRTARRRIDITTPYFVADRSLLDEMKAAVTRGVEVRLLVPGDETDSTLVRLASLALYPELIAAGVRIFEYQTTLIHVKVMVIDDDWSMIGSANFDNRSFELNDEIVLYVEDREFAERLTQSLHHDLERSVLITLDRYRTIALWRRLLGRLALALREQL